ncbi:MAG: hypothetical protein AB1753_01770 [Thermoproteota archaeon]
MVRGDLQLAPVLAGLVTGALFVVLLAQAINPPVHFNYGHADNPAPEDRELLDRIAAKARQQEPVRTFLARYPFASSGVYQYTSSNLPLYDNKEEEDAAASEFVAVFVYGGSTITRIEYDGRRGEESNDNRPLISYHYPSLWVALDGDGNIRWIELRCGISYLGNQGGSTQKVVQGYDGVMGSLQARVC